MNYKQQIRHFFSENKGVLPSDIQELGQFLLTTSSNDADFSEKLDQFITALWEKYKNLSVGENQKEVIGETLKLPSEKASLRLFWYAIHLRAELISARYQKIIADAIDVSDFKDKLMSLDEEYFMMDVEAIYGGWSRRQKIDSIPSNGDMAHTPDILQHFKLLFSSVEFQDPRIISWLSLIQKSIDPNFHNLFENGYLWDEEAYAQIYKDSPEFAQVVRLHEAFMWMRGQFLDDSQEIVKLFKDKRGHDLGNTIGLRTDESAAIFSNGVTKTVSQQADLDEVKSETRRIVVDEISSCHSVFIFTQDAVYVLHVSPPTARGEYNVCGEFKNYYEDVELLAEKSATLADTDIPKKEIKVLVIDSYRGTLNKDKLMVNIKNSFGEDCEINFRYIHSSIVANLYLVVDPNHSDPTIDFAINTFDNIMYRIKPMEFFQQESDNYIFHYNEEARVISLDKPEPKASLTQPPETTSFQP